LFLLLLLGEDFYRFRRSEIRIAHANHFLPDQGKMWNFVEYLKNIISA
jgi:hypothetical protein